MIHSSVSRRRPHIHGVERCVWSYLAGSPRSALHRAARTAAGQGLTTRFFTQDGVVHAVEDVSFRLRPGEVLGLVGESGCGKSVTGLSIMRLVPDPPGKIVAGSIQFKGENLLRTEQRRDAADSGQSDRDGLPGPDDRLQSGPDDRASRSPKSSNCTKQLRPAAAMTARSNCSKMVGIPAAERRARDYPHQYSGGMRQRAMIAMALACSPNS